MDTSDEFSLSSSENLLDMSFDSVVALFDEIDTAFGDNVDDEEDSEEDSEDATMDLGTSMRGQGPRAPRLE